MALNTTMDLDLPLGNLTLAPTGFLHLPGELRNNLYATLISDGPIHLGSSGQHKSSAVYPRKLNGRIHNDDPKRTLYRLPALLRTCKQIRNEALSFYAGNTFSFGATDVDQLKTWAQCIGTLALKQVQSVMIEHYVLERRQNPRFVPLGTISGADRRPCTTTISWDSSNDTISIRGDYNPDEHACQCKADITRTTKWYRSRQPLEQPLVREAIQLMEFLEKKRRAMSTKEEMWGAKSCANCGNGTRTFTSTPAPDQLRMCLSGPWGDSM
ncbi:hypothetical protein LTR56_014478 [Elasticomyces elasticus]|nr:hypothetical protein LTR56_014478 [Elasticomyces elasticus]KAK3646536.1 hypothetical protein LTR22_014299 [Elasticomyces elasticus]KAK4910437.1 hypothetical protein LTR49_020872 [Elasticomyces elasticus]KAK5755653.1 hypothetical protein LTS12_014214 [Elasticomyces elasticus]